jgi:hypothetical protein
MTRRPSWRVAILTAALALAACDDSGDPENQPPGSCDLTCESPPPSVCLDDAQLRVFSPDGRCEADACVYSPADVPCALGCLDGACITTVDACEGVVCDAPPSTCHDAAGTCRAGDCVYPPLSETVCDDGDTCTSGDTCQAGACLGDPMVCAEPPAATCAGDDIVSFASPGLCSDGQCAYGSTTATCPLGCEAGSCKGDPCAGVVCDVPLSACHLNVGVCQGGACNYVLDNGAQCDDGDACTQGDTCQTGQCAGTITACAAPPVATCTDASTLQSYSGAHRS